MSSENSGEEVKLNKPGSKVKSLASPNFDSNEFDPQIAKYF